MLTLVIVILALAAGYFARRAGRFIRACAAQAPYAYVELPSGRVLTVGSRSAALEAIALDTAENPPGW